MSTRSSERPIDMNSQPSSRTMMPRAMPANSALRSRAQLRNVWAWATPNGVLGSDCQVVLIDSQRSSGMTSRARRAFSRAATQEEQIGLGGLFDVLDAHQGEQIAAGVDLAGGVLHDEAEVGLQQPGRVLGPLD